MTYGIDEALAKEARLYEMLSTEEGRSNFVASEEFLDPDTINDICSSDSLFRLIVNDNTVMAAACEIKEWREAMYNNYAITESIIVSSSVALNAMKNSTQYASSTTARTNSYNMITVYSDKAFVFTCSAYSNRDYSIRLVAGYFVNGNSTIQSRGSSGKTLTMTLNKFASTVAASRDIGWDAQPITLTYFKI